MGLRLRKNSEEVVVCALQKRIQAGLAAGPHHGRKGEPDGYGGARDEQQRHGDDELEACHDALGLRGELVDSLMLHFLHDALLLSGIGLSPASSSRTF